MARGSGGDAGATFTEQPMMSGTLPLYRDARPVRSDTHGTRGIAAGQSGFGFAGASPLIPITVDEFELAALDYPIAFVGPEKRTFVVTGLAAEQNLFVDGEAYRAGAYVPAYLRRYPFVFARDPDDTVRILCLDEASDRVVDSGEDSALALFDGDQPTEVTRHALDFCQQFEAAEQRTTGLIALLDELGLFSPQQAHLNRPERDDQPAGTEMLLDYFAVDRDRLQALPVADLEPLAKQGALGPLYAQILSGQNWARLAARA